MLRVHTLLRNFRYCIRSNFALCEHEGSIPLRMRIRLISCRRRLSGCAATLHAILFSQFRVGEDRWLGMKYIIWYCPIGKGRKQERKVAPTLSTWTLCPPLGINVCLCVRWRNSHTHIYPYFRWPRKTSGMFFSCKPKQETKAKKGKRMLRRALLLYPSFSRTKRTVMRWEQDKDIDTFSSLIITLHWFHEWVRNTLIQFCFFAWNKQRNFLFPVLERSV